MNGNISKERGKQRTRKRKERPNEIVFTIKVPKGSQISKWDWIIIKDSSMRVKNKPYRRSLSKHDPVFTPAYDFFFTALEPNTSTFDPRSIGFMKCSGWIDNIECEVWSTKQPTQLTQGEMK